MILASLVALNLVVIDAEMKFLCLVMSWRVHSSCFNCKHDRADCQGTSRDYSIYKVVGKNITSG